ncbi:N-acetyltransferase [bacterium]|nr:N-acetyltransferase [bacterium]
MNIHLLRGHSHPQLARSLQEFEQQFRYPLGQGACFSISHGHDYVNFFAAIGEATVLVAEHQGRVLATLATVIRALRYPDGGVSDTVYLGDLKVTPRARGGPVLLRLLRAAQELLDGQVCGYGIVMEGTGRAPDDYTGRLQIPPFRAVARLMVLSISTRLGRLDPCPSKSDWEDIYAQCSPAGYVPLGGQPALRSQLPPLGLADPAGQACGLLEDTRRGKRLLLHSGQEMRAAHLSRLAWKSPRDGARLIGQAVYRSAEQGIPTLFVSLPWARSQSVLEGLNDFQIQPAPATVYGTGYEDLCEDWWVDSAEI